MPKHKPESALDPSYVHRWDELAVYNAEVERGLVHTPQQDERMAEMQRRFNAEVAQEAQYHAEQYTRLRRKQVNLKSEQYLASMRSDGV